jgi:uncharacterized NAD-dependent epimerase/dehydratase family protein
MSTQTPYLLFIGNSKTQQSIALAQYVVDLLPEYCIGEYALPQCAVTVDMPRTTIWQAAERGIKNFVIGFSDEKCLQDEAVLAAVIEALDAGFNITCGFTEQLQRIDIVSKKATRFDRKILDISVFTKTLATQASTVVSSETLNRATA